MENVKIVCDCCNGSGQATTYNGDVGVDECSACGGYGYFIE